MNRKKLQELVNELSDELKRGETAEVKETAQAAGEVEVQAVAVNGVSKYTDAYPNGFLYNLNEAGEVMNGLDVATPLYFDLDYETFLTAHKYDKNKVTSCVLFMRGKTRSAHSIYFIETQTGESVYEDVFIGGDFYQIDLKRIYDKCGTASFKMRFANSEDVIFESYIVINTWSEHYKPKTRSSAKLSELFITKRPDKSIYAPNEEFDAAGMVVKGSFDNGETETIFNYELPWDKKLKITDEFIPVKYLGRTVKLRIGVGDDNYYLPPDESKNNGFGIFIDELDSPYIRVSTINGKIALVPGEVELPGCIDFEVDFIGFLKDGGYSLDETTDYTLCIFGKLKDGNVKNCYVHEPLTNKRICRFDGVNNMYSVPLRYIYEQTGSANFRIFIEADGSAHEVFVLRRAFLQPTTSSYSSLKIVKPPKKTRYLVGERFDPTGMSVKASLTFGGGKIITDYSVSPNRALNEGDNLITISSGNKSVTFPITVAGYRVTPKFYKYSRTKTNGVWGKWSYETQVSNIIAARNGDYEYKTVMTLRKGDIVTSTRPTTGLRLAVYKNKDNAATKVRINGIETPFGGNTSYVYVGNIDKGETGTFEVDFEYSDETVSLNAGEYPEIYFCEPIDPTIESQKKNYSLAGGVDFTVNLRRGSSTFSFGDITSEEDCLGLNIAHVYNPDNWYAEYGKNFRLNLCERLDFSDRFAGPEITPVYTDGSGKVSTFTVVYSVFEGGKDAYIKPEDYGKIVGENGNYYYIGYEVKVSYLAVNGYKYLKSIDTIIEANSRYLQLKEENDAATLPVFWIKTDNLYKGFNADGKLVFTCDAFNHYTQIKYDGSGKIVSVEDGFGNRVGFVYNNGKLEKINDSRGREINFGYGDGVSSVTWLDAEKVIYKELNLNYAEITVNGVKVNVLTEVIDKTSGVRSQIDYNDNGMDGRVSKISDFSSFANELAGGEGVKVSALTFEYGVGTTTLTDEQLNEEHYSFNMDGTIASHSVISDNIVVKDESYEYVPFEKKVVKSLNPEYLGKYSRDNLGEALEKNKNKYDNYLITTTYLNGLNLPVKVEERVYVADGFIISVETSYTYDDECKITKEVIIKDYGLEKDEFATEFIYDLKTKLPLKSVKTVYNTKLTGKKTKKYTEVEEREYDKNGCVALTKNYRYADGESEDGASVFYTEKGYNDKKQLISETEERGLYCNTYRYKNNTNLLSEAVAPHGRIINYGYDGADRLSNVTSTAGGVENGNTITYEKGEIKSLNHNGDNAISYVYDEKHRPISVSIGDRLFENYSYLENRSVGNSQGDIIRVTNAKGERFSAGASYSGTCEYASYNDKEIIIKYYDAMGRLEQIRDRKTDERTTVEFDGAGNLKEYKVLNSVSSPLYSESYSYDYYGNVKSVTYKEWINTVREETFAYYDNPLKQLESMTTGDYKVKYVYRTSGQLYERQILVNGVEVDKERPLFVIEGKRSTHLPRRNQYNGRLYIDYSYDGCGNITEIRKKGVLTARYKYDSLNRLVREDNSEFNESYFYTYDENGNILTKETCAYTLDDHVAGTAAVKSYGYDKDRLKNYGEETFSYDSIGNPTTYRGKYLNWTMGRKLERFSNTYFRYDGQGKRISKSGINFCHDSHGRIIKQSNGLEFFYDATGLLGLKYDGKNYVYRKDIQGNIIALIDINGDIVVNYTYDAWGNHKITDKDGNEVTSGIGVLNPFRYRSYYYDTETGLYYLQTRYYDPEVGRFINMDGIDYADPETINGLNLYAYCGNNPVMNIDPNGTFLFSALMGLFFQTVVSTLSYVGMAVASIWDQDIRHDMADIGWNPFNSDETKTLNSQKVSFYKGAPVIRTGMNRSGTFGAIFLKSTNNINTLRHEYGHIVQQMMLGPIRYGYSVAIPSPPALGPWNSQGPNGYYNAPWETLADEIGGVSRTHSTEQKARAWSYYATSVIAPLGLGLFLLWK